MGLRGQSPQPTFGPGFAETKPSNRSSCWQWAAGRIGRAVIATIGAAANIHEPEDEKGHGAEVNNVDAESSGSDDAVLESVDEVAKLIPVHILSFAKKDPSMKVVLNY